MTAVILLVFTSRMSGREPLMSLCPGPFPYISVVYGRKSKAQSGDLPGGREGEREGEPSKTFFLSYYFLFLLCYLSLFLLFLSLSPSLSRTHTQVSRGPLGLELFEYVSVFSPDEPLASPVLAQMKSSGFYRHINLQLHWEEEERVTGK